MAQDTIKQSGTIAFVVRTVLATLAMFVLLELLPHLAVGVSEVQFILISTILLILGAGPLVFHNTAGSMTMLLAQIFAIHYVANRIVEPGNVFIKLSYIQALKLSTTYQARVVAWVAFSAIYC